MEYRRLGNSDLYVSSVAYGNWLTHGDALDTSTAFACVRRALETGITTFDTADMYADGRAEVVLGSALAGIRRESVVICSKVGLPMGSRPNDRGLSRKRIVASCHASLSRLHAEYLDLYQAHRFDEHTSLDETMSAFADLIRKGDIRHAGVSEWTPRQLTEGQHAARQAGFQLISNQPQYSLLWRVAEAEVMPKSWELGIGQITYSPLCQGVLTGKYSLAQAAPKGSRADLRILTGSIARYFSPELRERVELLRPIAESSGLSLAQLALAWVLRNMYVAAAIIGASRPEQISENVKAVGAQIADEVVTG